MSSRKGGRTALHPSHSTANIASDIGEIWSDLKKNGWANEHERPQRRGESLSLRFIRPRALLEKLGNKVRFKEEGAWQTLLAKLGNSGQI